MFCKKCGTEIKNGAQFCPKCGAKVKEMVSEPSFNGKQALQKFDMEQLLRKSGIDRLLKNVTRRQLIGIGGRHWQLF